MDSPADYDESPLDSDDVYACKGCGEILEEGKAFELSGIRWHLNCFRCNTCETLLDSDAHLLLLGDGSLICNNCTYSCYACGSKIEDLAILTGDQAFCASCFRCRNCKRKIENLRYARTSQGIFCMGCHESLMARRRKKSRAAANAINSTNTKLKKDDQSPMQVDKSLPALPLTAATRGSFPQDQEATDSSHTHTPTELSPRPRQAYTPNESSSRSSSRRPRERSAERAPNDSQNREGLTLPATTYRKNRHSAISEASDLIGGDNERLLASLSLNDSLSQTTAPVSMSEILQEIPQKKIKEIKPTEKDYFGLPKSNGKPQTDAGRLSHSSSAVSNTRKGLQECGRQTSEEETTQLKDRTRKAQSRGKSSSSKASPVTEDDTQTQLTNTPKQEKYSKNQSSSENFRLAEAPKGKKLVSRGDPESETSDLSASPVDSWRAPSVIASRKEKSTRSGSPKLPTGLETSWTTKNQEPRDIESRPSHDSARSSTPVHRVDTSTTARSIPRKEVPSGAVKNAMNLMISSSEVEKSPSSASSETRGLIPVANGLPILAPIAHQAPMTDDRPIPLRAPTRPPLLQQLSDTYMAPRAPPMPPPAVPAHTHKASTDTLNTLNASPSSPELPRWSSGGGDFTMDEDLARLMGHPEDLQQSPMSRRMSSDIHHERNMSETSTLDRPRHGRNFSETTSRTTVSPRWTKTHIGEDVTTHDVHSPTSTTFPVVAEEPAVLRKQLRNSEKRVAQLERQFATDKDLKSLSKKVQEKRKTISVLDSQTEIMIRKLEVLTRYVERAKNSKKQLNTQDLEDSAVKDFMLRLKHIERDVSGDIESLYEERNDLLEDKTQIMADRDRALLEFEQLSSKNAQLAEMNNDLTNQIQERVKSQSGSMDSPRSLMNGLGIYTNHSKDKSIASMPLEEQSLNLRPSTAVTVFGQGNSYSQVMEQDQNIDPAAVLSAPHVVNIRKGQATKKVFNWKRGGATVAKGVTKGLKGAFSSGQPQLQPQHEQTKWQGQTGENIGLPYNMTVSAIEAPAGNLPLSATRNISNDQRAGQGGFGLFKKSNTLPKISSNGNGVSPERPSTLFGSDLVERADYERRQIPSVVTRCIEEVELRGMDVEGIYRKTGGSGQVKIIQEGFEKTEDYDISDPGLDITAVTSVLKQYLRKLPTPLLTFEVYDRVLDSTSVEDAHERCAHLRETFKTLPSKHRDCLEFLIFHLARVAVREKENLMSPKNLAVVFAPTIMRDHSLEREMSDMHAKNNVIQFVIENSHDIFGAP